MPFFLSPPPSDGSPLARRLKACLRLVWPGDPDSFENRLRKQAERMVAEALASSEWADEVDRASPARLRRLLLDVVTYETELLRDRLAEPHRNVAGPAIDAGATLLIVLSLLPLDDADAAPDAPALP